MTVWESRIDLAPGLIRNGQGNSCQSIPFPFSADSTRRPQARQPAEPTEPGWSRWVHWVLTVAVWRPAGPTSNASPTLKLWWFSH